MRRTVGTAVLAGARDARESCWLRLEFVSEPRHQSDVGELCAKRAWWWLAGIHRSVKRLSADKGESMTAKTSSRGAQASYRGYRLQALYALDRLLLLLPETDSTIQPEGQEDIDILTKGQLVETVQVKSYPSLVFSHFTAGQQQPLVSRVKKHLARSPSVRITIVNFGTIGPELAGAWQFEPEAHRTVSRKLSEAGYSQQEISAFFHQVRLVELDETEVKARVFDALEHLAVGLDLEAAFELLTFWIYQQAEASTVTTAGMLKDRLIGIAKFLAEQRAHHQEWFTSIIPLEGSSIKDERIQNLRREFFAGVATRYEHILADLDIPRIHLLRSLHAKWQDASVIIIRAASGQGKTTLALRYIHDYYPGMWRFKVGVIQDRLHALQVARALSGFAAAVKSPMLIYVDVSPRDVDWPELIQRLANLPYLRTIVTIREEDFQRAELPGASFTYEELTLSFDREEAELFFQQAFAQVANKRFLDFEEAWTSFGGRGPLMEFMYALTQSQTLKERLSAQVKRIRREISRGTRCESELQVLRIVAVATAYEARVSVRELQRAVTHPDLSTCLSSFEQEYLIRRSPDGEYLEGLHPVRSALLTDLLHDRIISPWATTAIECIPAMVEEDVDFFLLRALSDHAEAELDLLELVRRTQWSTWAGYAAALRAQVWSIWRGQALPSDLPSAPDFLQRQLMRWLRKPVVRCPSKPQTDRDWAGVAWIWHCLARLNVPLRACFRVDRVQMRRAVQIVPLKRLAQLALSMHTADQSAYEDWWNEQGETVASRLAEEYGIVHLEENGGTVSAHYLFDNGGRRGLDSMNHHEATMERIWLLRQLMPHFDKYGAKAYFHDLGDELPMLVDDTRKTGIPKNMLHHPFDVQFTRVSRNLRVFSTRPGSWQEFVASVLDVRAKILLMVAAVKQWVQAAMNHECSQALNASTFVVVDNCAEVIGRPLRLPKDAVDPLGFCSEEDARVESEWSVFTGRAILIQRYQPFFSSHRKMISALENFVFHTRQIAKASLSGGAEKRDLHLSTSALHDVCRSIIPFQSEFKMAFASLVEESRLAELDSSEVQALSLLWSFWFCWTSGPSADIEKERAQDMAISLLARGKSDFIDDITRACLSISNDRVQAHVHETTAFGGDISIWIELECNDPRKLHEHRDAAIRALHAQFAEVKPGDLRWYIAERYFRIVVMIATVNGRAMGRSAWKFNTTVTLFGDLGLEDPAMWWKWALLPVAESEWAKLGIGLWDTAQLSMLGEVFNAAMGMRIMLHRLSSLDSLPPLTQTGRMVAETAAQDTLDEISDLRDSALDSIESLQDYWDQLPPEMKDSHPCWEEVVDQTPMLCSLLFSAKDALLNEGPETPKEYPSRLRHVAAVADLMIRWWLCELEDCRSLAQGDGS